MPAPPPPQRAHRPHELGPRVFKRGAWYAADLRPWGLGRPTLRAPTAAGWPAHGDPTDDPELADRWKWAYIDHVRESARNTHLDLEPAGRPLRTAVDEFLAQRHVTQAHGTLLNDRAVLEVHLLPHLGDGCPTDAIGTAELQRLFNDLAKQGYAPGTLRSYRHTLGAFFTWAGRKANPVRGVVVSEVPQEDVYVWSDDELEAIRTAADEFDRGHYYAGIGPHVRVPFPIRRAIELGVGMGGRAAELFALDWTAFRQSDYTVRITRQVERTSRGWKALKGKRARTALVLPSWWEHHRAGARGVLLATEWKGDTALRTADQWLNRVYDAAGVNGPGRGWHTLRHTYARRFIDLGGRLEELQKSLGHSSIVITERSYGHLDEDRAAALARRRIYGEGEPRLAPAAGGLGRPR